MKQSAEEIIRSLAHRRVLIVGDVMLDRYLNGSVNRISPEAPVPVVLHQSTEDRLGGAANVALNIKALGGEPVLCSVVGRDTDGDIFRRLAPAYGIQTDGVVASNTRRTTVKTRVLGNNQQMLRIDTEDAHDLSESETDQLLRTFAALLQRNRPDVIIFQDYNKGVLTETTIRAMTAEARRNDIPTAVDPKKANFYAYKGVTLFKPNLKEIRDSVPFSVAPDLVSLQKSADFLRERLENAYTMITLSEKGLFLDFGNGGAIYPTIQRSVADVSGAGDTVISVTALALAAGASPAQIALLSNLAGGQVCEYTGVVPVRADILERELDAALKANDERYA